MFGVYYMEAHAKSKYNELADLAAWQEIVKVWLLHEDSTGESMKLEDEKPWTKRLRNISKARKLRISVNLLVKYYQSNWILWVREGFLKLLFPSQIAGLPGCFPRSRFREKRFTMPRSSNSRQGQRGSWTRKAARIWEILGPIVFPYHSQSRTPNDMGSLP